MTFDKPIPNQGVTNSHKNPKHIFIKKQINTEKATCHH